MNLAVVKTLYDDPTTRIEGLSFGHALNIDFFHLCNFIIDLSTLSATWQSYDCLVSFCYCASMFQFSPPIPKEKICISGSFFK